MSNLQRPYPSSPTSDSSTAVSPNLSVRSQSQSPSPPQTVPLSDPATLQFRALLKKVGSGTHTSQSLSREESATATRLMLQEAATPAQIGAFMIAQRIKRPTPTELAGMLDTYDALGPQLAAVDRDYPVTVFCNPYDGRSRTATLTPLTALILATAGAPALLHGSGRLPTKHGLPLAEIFQELGLNWPKLTLTQVHRVLAQTGLGFVYQPVHFPLAESMVPYREQIGKRPTLATVEIMWSPYTGPCNLISGYVHPPTEERTLATFTQRNTPFFTTVKGLEGSCDLSRSRTAIISLNQLEAGQLQTERLLLHPRDYGFDGTDPAGMPLPELIDCYHALLAGQAGQSAQPNPAAIAANTAYEIEQSAIWNSGFYLWRIGRVATLEAGFELAQELLVSGAVTAKLASIQAAIEAFQ